MAENTAAASNTDATPCECSLFEALVPEQLTEENIANGNHDIFTTDCSATTKRIFAPGHDAKLKSFLIKHEAAGNEIRRNDGVTIIADAMSHANRYEFAHLVAAGIEKARTKAEARRTRTAAAAERKANKPKKAERKLAESAGVVAHDGNEARQAREAKSLAEVVAAEEAKHAAEVAANRPAPEWDDATTAAPATLEDDAAMNTLAREEREAGLVTAKVGRWEYQGHVDEDGKFHYLNKKSLRLTAPAGTYSLV